jgi:hypothetical protein
MNLLKNLKRKGRNKNVTNQESLNNSATFNYRLMTVIDLQLDLKANNYDFCQP